MLCLLLSQTSVGERWRASKKISIEIQRVFTLERDKDARALQKATALASGSQRDATTTKERKMRP
jgi:hypothetical protein